MGHGWGNKGGGASPVIGQLTAWRGFAVGGAQVKARCPRWDCRTQAGGVTGHAGGAGLHREEVAEMYTGCPSSLR